MIKCYNHECPAYDINESDGTNCIRYGKKYPKLFLACRDLMRSPDDRYIKEPIAPTPLTGYELFGFKEPVRTPKNKVIMGIDFNDIDKSYVKNILMMADSTGIIRQINEEMGQQELLWVDENSGKTTHKLLLEAQEKKNNGNK